MRESIHDAPLTTEHEVPETTGKRVSFLKIKQVIKEETGGIHLRYLLVQFLVSLLPHNCCSRIRTALYRLAGLQIGPRSLIMGKLILTGGPSMCSMLKIGSDSRINTPLYIELNAPVLIGNGVGIGHHVIMITTDHETGDSASRSGTTKFAPIVVEDGAWVGASVTILPGVTIGKGSVVAAGSLVSQSVPDNRVVGGVPARPVKTLEA